MPPARFRTPSTADRLKRFRGSRHPLPLGDKRVVTVVLIHLCFLPWALGTMHPWSQITSLVLAVIGFRVALLRTQEPEAISGHLSGDNSALRRLLKFPPFWLGLVLLTYITLQAFNPSWRYATDGFLWWLTVVPNLSWLPTSVDVPFERFNVWRQFIIYASAWLTLCTVAIGLTRRRSFGVLLTGLAINGFALVLVGLSLRLTQPVDHLLWLGRRIGTMTFASFIYKNHAGAYFALIAAVLLMLAARYRERALRDRATSSPGLLPVLGALVMLFAVIFTYSRGGTLLLVGYLIAAGLVFAVHRHLTNSDSGTPRVVTFTVAGMVAFVVIFALMQMDFRQLMGNFEKLTASQDVSVNQRLEVNEASRDMLSHTWPRGVGAGGFRHVFPQYLRRFEGSYQGGRLFWEHAHNDWLQIPIELGLVGSVLILGGGIWLLWRLGRRSVARSLPALLLAIGLLQTLAHAGIDFVFQNPAVLITWLVLALGAVRYAAPGSARVESGNG